MFKIDEVTAALYITIDAYVVSRVLLVVYIMFTKIIKNYCMMSQYHCNGTINSFDSCISIATKFKQSYILVWLVLALSLCLIASVQDSAFYNPCDERYEDGRKY